MCKNKHEEAKIYVTLFFHGNKSVIVNYDCSSLSILFLSCQILKACIMFDSSSNKHENWRLTELTFSNILCCICIYIKSILQIIGMEIFRYCLIEDDSFYFK